MLGALPPLQVYIQPLFNKFTPLEDGELKDRIFRLADKCKFPLTKLFVVPVPGRLIACGAPSAMFDEAPLLLCADGFCRWMARGGLPTRTLTFTASSRISASCSSTP